MACSTCDSAGSCGCSSVTIPVGPTGATGPAGPTGATGSAGPQGLQGPQGPTGATPAKYTNEFVIPNTDPLPTTQISYSVAAGSSAITACNALITCSSYTAVGCDYMISIWLKSGTQYKLVTENPIYVTSIIHETAGNDTLTINWASGGTYQVVVFG